MDADRKRFINSPAYKRVVLAAQAMHEEGIDMKDIACCLTDFGIALGAKVEGPRKWALVLGTHSQLLHKAADERDAQMSVCEGGTAKH